MNGCRSRVPRSQNVTTSPRPTTAAPGPGLVQQVAAAQALETPATDCLHTLTAQIGVERDMRHKATDVMAGDLAAHHREEVRQLLIATTVGAMAWVTAAPLARRCVATF